MKRKENLELIKKGLIIVDMVNGFIKEGALKDPHIAHIIPEIKRLALMYLKNEDVVIAFKDCHPIDSPEFETYPPHCIKGTTETELVDELKEYEDQFTVFEKDTTDGFYAPGFREYIEKMKNFTELVITGCCTDICVMNLALSLKKFFNEVRRDVEIIIPKNAVETFHIPGVHDRVKQNKMAFKVMRDAGIQVVKKLERK